MIDVILSDWLLLFFVLVLIFAPIIGIWYEREARELGELVDKIHKCTKFDPIDINNQEHLYCPYKNSSQKSSKGKIEILVVIPQ